MKRNPAKRKARLKGPRADLDPGYERAKTKKGVVKATPLGWIEIAAQKNGVCRVCGDPRTSFHHLLGGTRRHDVAANLIPLCGNGTMGCHGIYTSHHTGESFDGKRRTWRQIACAIRVSLSDEEAAWIISQVGRDGLDRRYPQPRWEHDLLA